jgi:hypothetical protein
MMIKLTWLIVLVFLICGCSPKGDFTLKEANDAFTLNNTDDNLTQSLSVTYREPDEGSEYKEFVASHDIYTPHDKHLNPPPEDQQPYAGHLHFTGKQYKEKKNYRDVYGINFGLVGPDARGKQIQNGVHRLIDNKEAQGWDYQLPNEFAAYALGGREWVHLEKTWSRQIQSNVITSINGRLGNTHTDITFLAGLKIGRNIPRFDFAKNRDLSIYLYSNGSARFVAYNIFYDGTMFSDSRSVDTARYVYEYDGGLGFEFYTKYVSPRIRLHYTLTTREYNEQKDWYHSIGIIDIGLVF